MKRRLKSNKLFITVSAFLALSLFSTFVYYNFIKSATTPSLELQPKVIRTFTTNLNNVATSTPRLKLADNVLGVKDQGNNLVTDKGNDLLVLVNKKISLPKDFVPDNLISLDGIVSAYPGAQLRADAASALKEMFEAASTANLNLTVVSSYRSFSQQQQVFSSWVNSAGLSSAETFSAQAGHSQHQLGTAVDLGAVGKNPLNQEFGLTPEGAWVANNSSKFGFVISYPKGAEAITGYEYEPWHYRYIGQENAAKMVASGLILEEYLQEFGTW